MLRRASLSGILILLSAALSLAADLNGRWEGSMSTPNGDFSLVFNFKVQGATLTGTVETSEGKFEITDGKVDGNKFSFKTHAGDSEINHEGTLSGDAIQLKVNGPWGDSEIDLKRSAEKPPAK
jgi:type V secretory pathway adhesin AidA